MNVPEGWMVYPLMEVTIGLFVILIAIFIVLCMILKVLKSFQQPKEEGSTQKERMNNLKFKDMI